MNAKRLETGWRLMEEAIGGEGFSFTAFGSSMAPAILPGDELILKPAPERIEIGEAVAYRTGDGQIRTHRALGHSKEGFLKVRGDNAWKTERVEPGRVFGVVDRVLREGKTLDSALWRPRETLGVRMRRLGFRLMWEARLAASLAPVRTARRAKFSAPERPA